MSLSSKERQRSEIQSASRGPKPNGTLDHGNGREMAENTGYEESVSASGDAKGNRNDSLRLWVSGYSSESAEGEHNS